MRILNSRYILFVSLLLLFCASGYSTSKLVVYKAPQGALLNDDFSVKVRQLGKKWELLPNYLVKVDEVRDAKHNVEEASMGYFDFYGEVEVSVTFMDGPIQKARIRPLSYGIEPIVRGNTLLFKLDQPRNLSIEINGN